MSEPSGGNDTSDAIVASERYQRLKEVFQIACETPAADRDAYLAHACGDDRALRSEIDALLHAAACDTAFLDSPVVDGDGFMRGAASLLACHDDESHPVTIGRYRIERLIADGGMGRVYEAEQDTPQRRVALKVVRASVMSPRMRQRFEHEVAILGRLHHKGIAQIHDAGVGVLRRRDGSTANVPFFAMEFVDGVPITTHAERAGLGNRERLELLAQVCDAVQYGHLQGVIHRDLKPANILVEASGEAKVIDFGVARATNSDESITTMHTDAGQILGTLAYMSPEQVSGVPAMVDSRTDVYSLGVVGYELLAGRLPFDVTGLALPQAVHTIRDSEPSRLSSISRVHRGDVETIIGKALERNPALRYQSAAELAADIRLFLSDEPIDARPPTWRYQLGKFGRRHKELVAGLVLVLVVLIAGIIGTSAALVRATGLQAAAEDEATRTRLVNDMLQRILGFARPGMEGGGREVRVVQMLDAAAADLAVHLKDAPDLELVARRTLGETYQRLGLFTQASNNFARAWELVEPAATPGSADAMTVRADLALCRSRDAAGRAGVETWQKLVRDEIAVLRPLLEHARSTLVSDDSCTQKLLLVVATLLYQVWDLDEGANLWRELHEIVRRLPPDRCVVVPSVPLGRIAFERWIHRDYDEALRLCRLAAVDETNPDMLMHVIDQPPSGLLAAMLIDHGRLEEAEQRLRQTIELQSRVLGDDHAFTIDTMFTMASLLTQCGRWDEARALWQRQRQYYESNRPGAVWIAYLLWYEAAMLGELDRPSDAAQLFEESIARFRSSPDGPDLSAITCTRGRLLLGLQTGRPWAGPGLRDTLRSLVFALLRHEQMQTLALDRFHWDEAQLSVTGFDGAEHIDAADAEIVVTGIDAIRREADLPPGLHRLHIVLPRSDAPPLEAETWVLFADWTVQLQGAGRATEPSEWESAVRVGPIEDRALSTLMLQDSFEEGFGPNRRHLSFEASASATIDLPAGSYRLITESDDGIRVWIDDELIIDHWTRGRSVQKADIESRGRPREVRLEYFQHGQDARLQVRMEPIDS